VKDPSIEFQQILQSPSVLGLARCSETGEIVLREGREVDSLTTVLGTFMRVAKLLPGACDGGDFHQASVQGKPLTVLCMPHDGGAVGVVLDERARVPEVALMLRRAIGRN
jgi:hypothetical protein